MTVLAAADRTRGAVAEAPSDTLLVRARILVLAVGFALVGAAAGDIFDTTEWVLVVAPLPVAAMALVLVGRPLIWRVVGAAAAILIAIVGTVSVADGSTSDVVAAVTSGFQGMLSTDWPSPTRADLLGTVAAVLATTCAASSEIATRRRFHLLGLLPLLLAYVGVVALSAPRGVTWSWLVGLTVVSTTFALLRNEGTLAERVVLLRGERRLLGLLGAALALVVLVTLPVSLGVRADPRRNDPAEQTASLLDPIEATLALRTLDPPVDLHRVTATDGDALPVRWRTAALSSYDGRRWSPSLTLRPIGSTLGPAIEPTIEADVSFLSDNLTLVPLPGPPVAVDAPVETDADRTVVRLAARPEPGDVVGVVANAPTPPSAAAVVGVATRLVDDSNSGLTQLAEGLAGDGDDLERLGRLEATMRDDFVLDSNVQGGGLEQALIDRFLRDTQRGTNEQFATSFVLLARSLGVEARVATGFLVDTENGSTAVAASDPLVLTSADADVWPEVQLADGSWIAYDPVPDEEAAEDAPPPPEPQVQAPAAPQPPIAPPPESDTEVDDDVEELDTSTDGAWSSLLTWVVRGSVAFGVVVLPLLIAAGLIVGVKYRRRRRRLVARDPTERIRGAWASATDALVDAGLDIGASKTNSEIATDGAPLAADATRQLQRLASMSSAATFGTPRHPDVLAEDAWSCLDSVEQAVVSVRTRWQRLRWRLSLRSLRRATRSPVAD